MRRKRILLGLGTLTALAALLSAAPAHGRPGTQARPAAQSRGQLSLWGLPAGARVYLDDRPVKLDHYWINLPPGRYVLQLEMQDGAEVRALRTAVDIRPGNPVQIPDLAARFRPVRVASGDRNGEFINLPGQAGEVGPPGPAALPMRPLPEPADPLAIREVLQPACGVLFDEFSERVAALSARLVRVAHPFYLYGPTKLAHATEGPPGPQGPSGLPGRGGLPAEVGLVRGPDGEPVLESWRRATLGPHEARLAVLERRLSALSAAAAPIPRVALLTPKWRAQLEAERARNLSYVPTGPDDRGLGGPQGPRGPMGARGADGVPPPGAKPVRLTKEQVAELLAAVDVSAQEAQVLTAFAELERRLWFAETDRALGQQRLKR